MAACAAALDQLQADAYLPAREQFDSIISHLRESSRMTHSELEQFLNIDGREMLRRIFQGYLDESGPGAVTEPVLDANGQEHTHQRLHSRSLTTIFGEVSLNRQGYGGRGVESLHPLDAELNLPPESYSHTLQRQIACATAKESYDEVMITIRDQTGVTVPKRQIEQSALRASCDFELFYEQQRSQNAREVKKTGPILSGWERRPDAQVRSAGSDSESRRRTSAAFETSSQSWREDHDQTNEHGGGRLHH
jgi:hypothetical protein